MPLRPFQQFLHRPLSSSLGSPGGQQHEIGLNSAFPKRGITLDVEWVPFSSEELRDLDVAGRGSLVGPRPCLTYRGVPEGVN